MTRPRSSYDYADQTVRSPSGTLALSSEGRRVVLRDPKERWSLTRDVSPKHLFVADDARAAIVGADDVLTFYDAGGAVRTTVSLLGIVDEELLSWSTAGRSWDDYLAGSFAEALFVLEGRGIPPLAFTPEGERSEADGEPVLRSRAPTVLEEALEALRKNNQGWREPWVFAAIGWARVVGRLQIDATDVLRELGELPLEIHGYTSAGLRGKRVGDDPILVDRWALDPLRQAIHLARLRLGIDSDLDTLKIGRKGKMLSTDWLELERPDDWTEGLEHIQPGATPSSVVADHGLPTDVSSSPSITWSYAWLRTGEPVSTNLTWDKSGVASVQTIPLPEPTPRGLIA